MSRLLTALLLSYAAVAHAQAGADDCASGIQVSGIDVAREAGAIELELLARAADCRPERNLRPGDLRITEQIGDGTPREVTIRELSLTPKYDTVDLREEAPDVLFAVDVGRGSNPALASELIGEFLRLSDTAGRRFGLLPFAAGAGAESRLPAGQLLERARGLRREERPAHLNGALVDVARRLTDRDGKQLVVVIASGTNAPPDYGRLPRLPPGPREVFEAVARVPDLFLFTVGTDAAAPSSLLRELPGHTITPQDDYATARLPSGLAALLGPDQQLIATHTAAVVPADGEFRGRQRTYAVTDLRHPDAVTSVARLRRGSYNDRFSLGSPETSTAWVPPTLVGLLGVAGLLAVFFFVVPLVRERRFRSQHVVPYAPEPGRQLLDPLTREPIGAGEPVVTVCARVVPLQTWEDCGGQCPHYPGCTSNNLQCEGKGQARNPNFFALQGDNRRLNWIWFGAVGGVVGWILYAIAANVVPGFEAAGTLIRDGLLGTCFGTGVTLMLAVMEERSQSRQISAQRIGLRTVIGAVVATATFGGSYLLLEYDVISSPVLAAIPAWLLFGLGMGAVLTIRSTIDERRGLLGGLLAGAVGFGVYWAVGELFGTDRVAQVIGLLISGGLLGGILDTVVQLAETYEMEYISPANYQRRVPLSKWLRSGWSIAIGSQPGSQVYVKWPDEDVLPEHAQLAMDGGRVFLMPRGETLVNDRIIMGDKRVQLESGDTIQLGRRGQTRMRFWAEAEATQ